MGKSYCLFAANYLPNLGGVERYVYNLAKQLIAKGNSVTVVTSNVFKIASKEVLEGIEVYRMPCFNVLGGRFPVVKKNAEFKRLHKELLQKKFDIVVLNTKYCLHSLYGAKYAEKIGAKCIEIEHGTDHFTVNNKLLDFAGEVYEHWITSRIKAHCKNFYGVSEACNEWLAHFKIKAKGCMYNAVNVEEIKALTDNAVCDYRKEYGIPDDAVVITYTGRLVKEKGIEKLVNAFARLRKAENAYLFVAGSGDMFDEISARNQEGVIMLGKIDFEHIAALLKSTDVFCLPTDFPEGFPTSVLEAAAAGCFVVTTTSGGSKELIINDDYGIIMKRNDEEEIYESILKPVKDGAYRKLAVENAYKRLCDNFTWDKTSDKLIHILEKEI